MSILQEPMGIECYHVVAELERFTIFEIVVSQERLPHFQDMLIRLWKLFGPFSLWHKDLVRATNIVQSLLQAQTAGVKQRLVADPLMNDTFHQHNVPCSIQI